MIEQQEPILRPRAHRETLLLLSFILSCLGESDLAFETAVEGTERGRTLNSPFITAVGYMRQGHAWLLRDADDIYSEARRCFENAIEIGDNLAVARLKVEAFWGLTRVFGYQGDVAHARKMAQRGIDIAQQAGDEWVTACIYTAMGASYFLNTQYEEAFKWVSQAHVSMRECSDTYGEAVARLWQCLIWHTIGDKTRLNQGLEDLLTIAQNHGYDPLFTRRTLAGPPEPRCLVPLLIHARSSGIHSSYVTRLLKQLRLEHLEYHPGYRLRIQLFGEFRLWRGSEEVDAGEWRREKARQLFLLLLTLHGTMHDKNKLADYLWPDMSGNAADRNFRVTLNALYQVLEPNRERGMPSAYIERQGSLYGIRSEADIWFDVKEFENFIKKGDKALAEDKETALSHYMKALKFYQGDLLAVFTQEDIWWRSERERMLALYLRTADRCAQILADSKAWESVIQVCQDIISHDNWWERAYRLQMTAYAELGNRPQAIRIYHNLEQVLVEDLETIPSPETTQLFHTLSESEPPE